MSTGEIATTNWLAIATLIVMIITMLATVVAPVLAVLVQYRMSQPKPNPEANQPKNLNQSKGERLKRQLKSFWIFGIAIFINLLILAWELAQTTPLDRWAVLGIALSVASITFLIILMIIFRIIEILVRQTELNSNVLDRIKDIAELMKYIIEAVKITAVSTVANRPQGLLDKIQTAFKKLIGD